MLKYPDDFDAPAFPAGKPVAVSRFMGTVTAVLCVLIIFVAGLVLWSGKSQKIHPFLISVNEITGQWELVGHDHGQKTITRAQALQESLLARFTDNWFHISPVEPVNTHMWAQCERESCTTRVNADTTCAIFCDTSDEQFNVFSQQVKNQYLARFESGESWSVTNINMTPNTDVSDKGGLWTIQAKVKSNLYGSFDIIAYARVSYNPDRYPQTMGYYVDTFYAYKVR